MTNDTNHEMKVFSFRNESTKEAEPISPFFRSLVDRLMVCLLVKGAQRKTKLHTGSKIVEINLKPETPYLIVDEFKEHGICRYHDYHPLSSWSDFLQLG
jgi:hypothetical protein